MDEIRWSKWLESMQKDVECTFVVLKGRWRILKSGIHLQGIDAVDNIWLMCCALHNWLLEIDGLNAERSEISIPGSDWEGELGDCNFEGINVRVPWSLARLSQRLERDITLNITIDPTLLGGAIIRAGNLVFDGSVRTQIKNLSNTLAA